MTTAHDYAGCLREPCVRCHDYGLGWAHGKVKMVDELLALASGGGARHAPDCGCRPCGVIREIVRRKGVR